MDYSHGVPELGKVSVGFEGVAALVSQGRPVVGQALLLLPNVQVDLLAAAEQTRARVRVRVSEMVSFMAVTGQGPPLTLRND